MTMHPSEQFVATYLEELRWITRTNFRVKLYRNWSDIDVLALPSSQAEPPIWMGSNAAVVPQVIQVKYRGVFSWDLSKADPQKVINYLWPEFRIPVLHEAAKVTGGPFDWVLLGTRLWIPDPPKLSSLRMALLDHLKKRVPQVRDVYINNLEQVAGTWANHRAERASGWCDDPFSFLLDVLSRAGLLNLVKARVALFSHATGLIGLVPVLEEWSKAPVADLSVDGPLADVHTYLVELAHWNGYATAGTGAQAYNRKRGKLKGVQEVYVTLDARKHYYVTIWRAASGSVGIELWYGKAIQLGDSLDLGDKKNLEHFEEKILQWMANY